MDSIFRQGIFCSCQIIKVGFCGRSQRKSMIHYNLNKPLQLEKLVRDIENLLNRNKSDFTNKVLSITIKDITDYAGDNPIPKLTHEINNVYN